MFARGLRPRGVLTHLVLALRQMLPTPSRRTEAPQSNCLSRLNTRPSRSPVNASHRASRHDAHDSGSEWVTSPSLYGTCIHYTSPISRRSPCPTIHRHGIHRVWRRPASHHASSMPDGPDRMFTAEKRATIRPEFHDSTAWERLGTATGPSGVQLQAILGRS